ncbi:MbnP family protein [Flavivirga abyssicola]|uniref:MbnP family protein n=1 Tax=Flavivirga abyssicola TaxID=3063533 RepID=UPI0026E0F5C3|nr:MbnP family protein [Flavivirga sp. MEBiC07777]WVK14514.1 MbnP family protein [Flavivirga sp. MEBiC07777]
MRNILPILVFSFITLLSCGSDNDDEVSQANVTFNFSHNWDTTTVTNSNFNTIQYTNENGEELSITKLRYLISNITFQKSDGETFVLDGYNLVDVTNNTNLSFTPVTTIPTGTYNKVLFTFGFNNDANYNNNYPDLNSATWNVPAMLGGGYHYMQLEGKFIDNTTTETGYAYHAIRAVDNSGTTQVFQDTFFEVDLGEVTITHNATFEIDMNIAEWFKNPNTWNLNVLNNMLMPNFNAQVMMSQNGQNVFSLNTVNQ